MESVAYDWWGSGLYRVSGVGEWMEWMEERQMTSGEVDEVDGADGGSGWEVD